MKFIFLSIGIKSLLADWSRYFLNIARLPDKFGLNFKRILSFPKKIELHFGKKKSGQSNY